MPHSASLLLCSGMILAAATSFGFAEEKPEVTIPSPLGPDLQNIPVEDLEKAYEGRTAPEGVRMYLAIMKGSQMGSGEGWFGPGQSKHSWDWLVERCHVEDKSSLSAEHFPGTKVQFNRLDRNRDGRIVPSDLDWSDRNPWVQQAYLTNRLFRKMNTTGDGALTREQWLAFFEAAAEGKEKLSASDLRDHWLAGMGGGFLPGDAPSKEILLHGLFAGEIGSLQEGPQIGDPAPDFHLKAPDGAQAIHLAEVIGDKPVVLVFGNYTCGPFRSMYAEVDEIAQRYRDQATFIGVYVREAHPTDGWKMASNEHVGVAVEQPKTLTERTAVAQQCLTRIKPTIPWVVDDVNDATGHAYSGMPARLYVIDRAGKVTYKGGRGPFGFKAGEMEQALIMTLIDGNASGTAAGE